MSAHDAVLAAAVGVAVGIAAAALERIILKRTATTTREPRAPQHTTAVELIADAIALTRTAAQDKGNQP